MRVLVIPHLCQHLVRLVSLILVHLVGVYSGICLVLICISLMINDDRNDVDHSWSDLPFVYLLCRNVQIFCHLVLVVFYSVQFSSVAQSCPTLCDPMNCNTPGLPVHHQLPEFTQTQIHLVGDAI